MADIKRKLMKFSFAQPEVLEVVPGQRARTGPGRAQARSSVATVEPVGCFIWLAGIAVILPSGMSLIEFDGDCVQQHTALTLT